MKKSCLALGLFIIALLGFSIAGSAAQVIGTSGKCLDVQGGGAADRTPVILFRCHGSPNQQWYSRNGQIVGIGGKCLDVQGGLTADRTRVILFQCHGGPNQQWSVR